MSPEEAVALGAVTARLIGHDPKQWVAQQSHQVVTGESEGWFALNASNNGDALWFKTELEALYFCRTGVEL